MNSYNTVMCQELDAGWDLMGNGPNGVVIAKRDEKLRAGCSRSRGKPVRGESDTQIPLMQWI